MKKIFREEDSCDRWQLDIHPTSLSILKANISFADFDGSASTMPSAHRSLEVMPYLDHRSSGYANT
jgi:hypothetical protein